MLPQRGHPAGPHHVPSTGVPQAPGPALPLPHQGPGKSSPSSFFLSQIKELEQGNVNLFSGSAEDMLATHASLPPTACAGLSFIGANTAKPREGVLPCLPEVTS